VSGPLPVPTPTGVRIAGDHYQWQFAWLSCLGAVRDALTNHPNPVLSVGVEIDGVGNLDDVVLYRLRQPHSYHQVKYTVDSSTPVNFAYLTAASSTGGPSILSKISSSRAKLGRPVELHLVSNRAPDPKDVLIADRDARTGLLLPRAAAGGPKSERGRARAKWAAALGIPGNELLELLAALHFDLARDPAQLHETVSLTMLVTGLRGDTAAVEAGAGWIAQQVRDGRRVLELATITEAIDTLALRAGPTRTVISIATLKPDPLSDQAQLALDWVDRFDGEDAYLKRRPKPPASWSQLQAEIETIPTRLAGAAHVVVTGSLRLAPAFAVGAALRMVTNTDVAVLQRDQLWSSDTPYDAPQQPAVLRRDVGKGPDLAIAIGVATEITDDVLDYVNECDLPIATLITLAPPGGALDRSVTSPGQANALAVGLRDAARRTAKGNPRVHLFLAAPMGLALLLGHRWNRVAPTVVYEDLKDAGYEAAFTVSA
jgi:SMODS-associated and fused to various effectors sensor domain